MIAKSRYVSMILCLLLAASTARAATPAKSLDLSSDRLVLEGPISFSEAAVNVAKDKKLARKMQRIFAIQLASGELLAGAAEKTFRFLSENLITKPDLTSMVLALLGQQMKAKYFVLKEKSTQEVLATASIADVELSAPGVEPLTASLLQVLAVDPKYQGQKLGSFMLQRLEKAARAAVADPEFRGKRLHLVFRADTGNAAMRHLADRQGYTVRSLDDALKQPLFEGLFATGAMGTHSNHFYACKTFEKQAEAKDARDEDEKDDAA